MIYDCPQCQTPQPPGVKVCRHCGVEFDGPVPEDAIMPENVAAPELAPDEAQAAGLPEASYAAAPVEELPPVPDKAASGLDDAPLPPPSPVPPPLPAPSAPYVPAYSPVAPAYPAAGVYPAPIRSGLSPAAVLLIVVPLALLLIFGTIFLVNRVNQDTPLASAPPSETGTPIAAPANVGPPTFLHAGSEASSAHVQFDPATRWLVGRWVASRSSEYYVFKDNGTGYRGKLSGADQTQTFLWYIVQKQLILYSEQKENLAFSEGPDDNTLFLRAADGRSYKTYLRTGDNG